jgi:hypothetical protein
VLVGDYAGDGCSEEGFTPKARRAIRSRVPARTSCLREAGFVAPARAELDIDAGPGVTKVRSERSKTSMVMDDNGVARVFRGGQLITEQRGFPTTHLRWTTLLPDEKRIVVPSFSFGCERAEYSGLDSLALPLSENGEAPPRSREVELTCVGPSSADQPAEECLASTRVKRPSGTARERRTHLEPADSDVRAPTYMSRNHGRYWWRSPHQEAKAPHILDKTRHRAPDGRAGLSQASLGGNTDTEHEYRSWCMLGECGNHFLGARCYHDSDPSLAVGSDLTPHISKEPARLCRIRAAFAPRLINEVENPVLGAAEYRMVRLRRICDGMRQDVPHPVAEVWVIPIDEPGGGLQLIVTDLCELVGPVPERLDLRRAARQLGGGDEQSASQRSRSR